MFRKTTCVLLLAFLALGIVGGAIPASAKPPAREVFRTKDGSRSRTSRATASCTRRRWTRSPFRSRRFNKAGDPIKESNKANFFGTITNSLSGNTYRDHATFTETATWSTGPQPSRVRATTTS